MELPEILKRIIPHSMGLDLILQEEGRLPELPEEISQLIASLKEGENYIHKFKAKIKEAKDIISVDGIGGVKELTIISDRGDLKIICENDGYTIVDDTIEKLIDISPFVSTIEAMHYNDKYIFRIKDVSYRRRFRARVIPEGETSIECFYNYFNLPPLPELLPRGGSP
ncbi:MAG: hypothetical protein DRN17_06030 [Thermoplasmata archaeon]|nr:MAG: hypothetical protein DRN17_06030 [Thermoplasmata archaeon]